MTSHRTVCLLAGRALIALTVVVLGAPSHAEVVTLKSGETFRGKVVLQTDTEIQIQTGPGAVLTFSRDKVETIEPEHAVTLPPTGTGAPRATPPAAKDLKEIQDQIAALREDVQKLQDEVAKLRDLQEQVTTRAAQVAQPRGDLPGEESSKLELVNMRWTRAGDNIKVEGAIRNTGGSPGRWVRVTAVVKDPLGVVIGQAQTTPDVTTPGVAVRDFGWVVPGKDVNINIFVPFGGWSKNSTLSSTDDTAHKPRRLPRITEITVEWKLEVPPKFTEPAAAGPEEKGAESPSAGAAPATSK